MHPLLSLLKHQGARSTTELGRLLGTSAENARRQLNRLAADGLVALEARATPHPGRPRHIWSLTPLAHARFPDTHADFSMRMVHAIRQTFGENALARLVALREAEDRQRYTNELGEATTPAARIGRLAELRTQEGYMADWHRNWDGSFDLIENHCPICAAAGSCVDICAAELAVFQSILGAVTIRRTEHIICGDRRCVYRITLSEDRAEATCRV